MALVQQIREKLRRCSTQCYFLHHLSTFHQYCTRTRTHAHWHAHAHAHTHTHPSWSSDILYQVPPPLWSITSSLFNLRAWQSFSTTSLQVLSNLPLGLGPLTSYSMHFFTQSLSFHSTCPYHRSQFCCNTNAMSSITNLPLSSLLGNLSFSLTPHIHLTILISARWSATSFHNLI